jgi:hypothetical protein
VQVNDRGFVDVQCKGLDFHWTNIVDALGTTAIWLPRQSSRNRIFSMGG